jgi:LysM repeat protein
VDPRITVQRIIDINGLDGVIIQPGQRLVLPPK